MKDRPLILIPFALSAFAVGFLSLRAADDDDGFTTIFDGKDLSKIETEGNWSIESDGSLHLVPRPGEKGWQRYGSYIWLKDDYEDFVFDFEYKHEEGGNSGFYFRVADKADPVASGFEVQILDCWGKEELGPHDLGGVIKTAGPLVNAAKKPGEWNRMIVTLKGSHLKVELNGKTVQDVDLAEAKPKDKELASTGRISIQDHGLPFWVRNLRVKRL
ncbi:MAG: DUF1080 domain-containing protein [Verrucomicrobiae bacterium]|nr:DUF1080 domain-containing protein [Verrucomicrobiae bacterium]